MTGGFCALLGVFIMTLPIPIVVNSFASYYKNRLWRNEVSMKKRERIREQVRVSSSLGLITGVFFGPSTGPGSRKLLAQPTAEKRSDDQA